MAEIWTMGEILVEVMRPRSGIKLHEKGEFIGPFPSGAPAIFIDTAARLGHSAGIIGGVGADDFGKNVMDRLKNDGVGTDYVISVQGRTTAVAFVTYFSDGSRKFIFHIDGTPAVMARHMGSEDFSGAKFFHIMGCSLMANDQFREEIIKTATACHNTGAKISFDPNIRPELCGSHSVSEIVEPIMKNCSVLMPGTGELCLLAGKTDVKSAIDRIFSDYPVEIIVLKQGKDGATAYTREEKVALPVYKVTEVDPTGAGDCFDAGFICGLLEGRTLFDCGRIAAAAGALNAAAFGPMEGDISPASVKKIIGEI